MNLPAAITLTPPALFVSFPWISGKIHAGVEILPTLAATHQVNAWALEKKFPLTSISLGCLGKVLDDYLLLPVGVSFMHTSGPLLIAKENFSLHDLGNKRIAINGVDSTEHLLFKLLCPQPAYKHFSNDKDSIALLKKGAVDCALVNPLTADTQKEGFFVLADLSSMWKSHYNLPLPLNGLAAKRSLGNEQLQSIIHCLKNSLKAAWEDSAAAYSYILEKTGMGNLELAKQQIQHEISQETQHLSEEGIKSIELLWNLARERHMLPPHHAPWLMALDEDFSQI